MSTQRTARLIGGKDDGKIVPLVGTHAVGTPEIWPDGRITGGDIYDWQQLPDGEIVGVVRS